MHDCDVRGVLRRLPRLQNPMLRVPIRQSWPASKAEVKMELQEAGMQYGTRIKSLRGMHKISMFDSKAAR